MSLRLELGLNTTVPQTEEPLITTSAIDLPDNKVATADELIGNLTINMNTYNITQVDNLIVTIGGVEINNSFTFVNNDISNIILNIDLANTTAIALTGLTSLVVAVTTRNNLNVVLGNHFLGYIFIGI